MTASHDIATGLSQAVDLLKKGIDEWYAHPDRVARIEVAVRRVDPLGWITSVEHDQKIFWSDRPRRFVSAGVGEADVIALGDSVEFDHLFEKINSVLGTTTDPVRYFGGCNFDLSRPANGRWSIFGACRFVLPRFELRRYDDRTTLACHLLPQKDAEHRDEILAELESVAASESKPLRLPALSNRTDLPDRENWETMIEQALTGIDNSKLEKVVLARRTSLTFDQPLEPVSVLARLVAEAGDCFHYCLQPAKGIAMVGASPERLYFRYRRDIESDALAGTRARGVSSEEDNLLAEKLLGNEKELREHRYVLDELTRGLKPLCDSLQVDNQISIVKLAKVQHLSARLKGTLAASVTDADVLKSIHPTPAVGGYPRDLAMDRIRELEPFDRGWYAGPVGWIGSDAAEFAVAIRCGLISDDKIDLYSGAGVIAGSVPKNEWKEIETKIANFVKALTTYEA